MPNADITKRIIADAMKTLMCKKPFSKISIASIVEQCGITRNSFYYHFRDKYDLVNWIFYTEIGKELNSLNKNIDDDPWEAMVIIIGFFYENADFYKNAFSVTGQNSFYEYFNELIKEWLILNSEELFEAEDQQQFFSTFFADALTITICRWLKSGAVETPQRISALIKNTISAITDISEEI